MVDEPKYPLQLPIRVTREMAAEIRAWAKEEDRTVSQQVRWVLRQALDRKQLHG